MAATMPNNPSFSQAVLPFRRRRPRPSRPKVQEPTAGWVMFDRRVTVLGDETAGVLASSSRSAYTADGHEVRVHLESPPALSLALLLDGEDAARPDWRKPSVIASDAAHLLLRVPSSTEAKLLVFSGGPGKPSVIEVPQSGVSLGRRGTGILSHDKEDYPEHVIAYLKDLGGVGSAEEVKKESDYVFAYHSALSIGDGSAGDEQHKEFVIAYLESIAICVGSVEENVARVSIFSSLPGKWAFTRISMPQLLGGVGSSAWRSHTTVSYAGCVIWIDFSRGMLVCDVLEKPPALHFLVLPTLVRASAESRCSVSVSQDLLRFVCINPRAGLNTATITIWTLDDKCYVWNESGGIRITCPPPFLPQFPLLSGQDPDIVHFILQQDATKFICSVNWRTCEFVSRCPYYVEETLRVQVFETPYVGSNIARYVTNAPVLMGGFGYIDEGIYHIVPIQPREGHLKACKMD